MNENVWTLILLGGGLLAFLLVVSFLSKNYSLNNFKNKTVGDGQHGTARWATPREISKTYRTVPFRPRRWRKGEDLPTVQGLVLGSVGGRKRRAKKGAISQATHKLLERLRRPTMAYYTERHTMREPVKKTYDISVDVYTLIFQCCEKYYNNLAWKYPDQCPDGYGCCGLDLEKLNLDLKYEIPTLFRDDSGRIGIPSIHSNIFSNDVIQDEYDQFALLDYVEFFADNVRDVEIGDYHKYFGHHHLIYKDSRAIVLDFKQEINKIFQRTGVLYCLNADLQVERVIEGSPLTTELENTVTSVKEPGTRELIQKAIELHRSYTPDNIRFATEKIWDAYERLKTYYTSLDKRASADKIIFDMSASQPAFIDLFTKEFKALTEIGNSFTIRHHETNKIEISDLNYYDHFFNRCLSLIALAVEYLQ